MTIFKAAYGFGLRRNESRMLDAVDFGRNPEGQEFGEYGVLNVRYGKAMKGSPPKRRSVLCVWAWVFEVLEQWFTEVRLLFGAHPLTHACSRRGDPSPTCATCSWNAVFSHWPIGFCCCSSNDCPVG